MRRSAILLALALVLGAGLAWAMQEEQGYLLIAAGHYTIEMSLWVAVLTLLILWVVSRVIWHLVTRIGAVKRWLRVFSSGRAQLTSRGQQSLAEGRWDRARRDLLKGAVVAERPHLNYLGAARAATEVGDYDAAQQLFLKAEELAGDDSLCVAVARAQWHIDRQDYRSALADIKRLHGEHPHHPHLLKMLQSAYLGLGDWPALLALLPELKNAKGFAREQWSALQHRVYLENLRILVKRGTTQEVEAIWRRLPKELAVSDEPVALYAEFLQRSGEVKAAEKLLRQRLSEMGQLSPRLLQGYGALVLEDPAKQLQQGERWLQDHPNCSSLLILLGELSLRAELWGKARDYFERALSISAEPLVFARVYAQLGALMNQLGDADKSAEYYRLGLQASTSTQLALQ